MKLTSLKTIMLHATWVTATLFGATACNSNQATDTKEIAEDHNDAKFDNNAQEKIAQFLVDADAYSLEAISLGQLATQKGTSAHVRELGKTLQSHYQSTMNDLSTLAKSKTVTLPSSLTGNGQQDLTSLSNKSGTDFDKSYADQAVKSLKEEISALENASTESTDSDIRAWASNSLPTLRKHLDLALTCQAECSKM